MGKSNLALIKHAFFNHSSEQKNAFSFKEDDFDLDQLRFEFSSLLQLFLSNKQHWLKDVEAVFYLNVLCDLMICYYEYDYTGAELKKLKEQKKEIEAFIQVHLLNKKQNVLVLSPAFLLAQANKSQSSFFNLYKLRKYVGDINSKRSHFNYSRNLATQVVTYLEKSPISEVIYELNTILGNQYSFVEGLNLLNNSREALALLGIALFAIRFLINLILMIKHVLQATLNNELSATKVLKQELEKRAFIMASDLVWSIVSLLTTYNNFFHISSLAIPPLVLSFLIFDILLFLAQGFFEATKHNQRLNELLSQKKDATPFEQAIITRQIDVLNDEWDVQCTYYAINLLGAHILAGSFAITLLYTGPLAIAGLAIFSMFGNALYNTAEDYKKYQQSRIMVKRELANGAILYDAHHQKLMEQLNEECNQNYNDFLQALAFNVGGIAFIITATVISWPIALSLTLAYVSYQLNNSYQQQLTKNTREEVPHDIYRLLHAYQDEDEALEHSCQARLGSMS